jgi:ABC-type multidrug transport system fused ATPase/permease subunit
VRVLRACFSAGGRGRVSLLLLLALLALSQQLLTFGCALAWGKPWLPYTLVAIVVVGVSYRAARTNVRTDVLAHSFGVAVEALLDEHAIVSTEQDAVIPIADAVQRSTRALVDGAVPLAANALASAVVLVLLAREVAPMALLTALVLFGAVALVTAALRRRTNTRFERTYAKYLGMIVDFTDAFDGRVEVIGSGASSLYLERAKARCEAWRRASVQTELVSKIATWLPLAVAFAVVACVLIRSGIDFAVLRPFILFAGVAPALTGVARDTHELWNAIPQMAPLAALLDRPPTRKGGRSCPNVTRVDWDGVTFAYDSRVVLDGVTLEAEQGTVIVVAGPNGSGKSTLLRTAVGLIAPRKGEVRIGDAALTALDRDSWRVRLRYLPQRPYLLPRRDVRAAMRFPSSEVDDDAMNPLLRKTGLFERLAAGDGLDSPTDSLSAGEKQRLALARVLVQDGDVYLLDEPDANLDAAGVKMVAEILRELADAGKIVVVAAHTPELIAAADRVVYLENGRVTSIEERSKGTPASEKRRAAES